MFLFYTQLKTEFFSRFIILELPIDSQQGFNLRICRTKRSLLISLAAFEPNQISIDDMSISQTP